MSIKSTGARTPFETENKSLVEQVTETKTLDTPAEEKPAADGVLVEMIHHGDYDGAPLLPGQKVSVPARIASSWVAANRARLA